MENKEIKLHRHEKMTAYNDGVVYAEDQSHNIFQRSRGSIKFYQDKKKELLKKRPNCRYCNIPLTFKTATLDHIKPLRYGGTDKDDNLALACRECNENKGCKMVAIRSNPICTCGRESEKVTGEAIYPHRPDLFSKTFYRCKPCGVSVGCHSGTDKPLGHLATEHTRQMRVLAHRAFDTVWKEGLMSRQMAYVWLSVNTGIPAEKCHIGMMDVEQCKKVIELCANAAIAE